MVDIGTAYTVQQLAATQTTSGSKVRVPLSSADNRVVPGTNKIATKKTTTAKILEPFKAASGKAYPSIPLMHPYAKIPPISEAAINAVKKRVAGMAASKEHARVVKEFNNGWIAWAKTWFATGTSNAPAESVATPEFSNLVKLGHKIKPLIVDKLTSSKCFPSIYLYSRIEACKDFKVSTNDLINFAPLQRQANLIVEMNCERFVSPAPSPLSGRALVSGKPTTTPGKELPIRGKSAAQSVPKGNQTQSVPKGNQTQSVPPSKSVSAPAKVKHISSAAGDGAAAVQASAGKDTKSVRVDGTRKR